VKDAPVEVPIDNRPPIAFANPFAAHGLFGQL
jgi:hypothetical protein